MRSTFGEKLYISGPFRSRDVKVATSSGSRKNCSREPGWGQVGLLVGSQNTGHEGDLIEFVSLISVVMTGDDGHRVVFGHPKQDHRTEASC